MGWTGEEDWRPGVSWVFWDGGMKFQAECRQRHQGAFWHVSGIFVVKLKSPDADPLIKRHAYLKYMRRRELTQQCLASGDAESTESLVTSISHHKPSPSKLSGFAKHFKLRSREFWKTTLCLAWISSLGRRKFDLLPTNSFHFHSNWDLKKKKKSSYCPK